MKDGDLSELCKCFTHGQNWVSSFPCPYLKTGAFGKLLKQSCSELQLVDALPLESQVAMRKKTVNFIKKTLAQWDMVNCIFSGLWLFALISLCLLL
jgi:hypothetical protein